MTDFVKSKYFFCKLGKKISITIFGFGLGVVVRIVGRVSRRERGRREGPRRLWKREERRGEERVCEWLRVCKFFQLDAACEISGVPCAVTQKRAERSGAKRPVAGRKHLSPRATRNICSGARDIPDCVRTTVGAEVCSRRSHPGQVGQPLLPLFFPTFTRGKRRFLSSRNGGGGEGVCFLSWKRACGEG